MANTTNLNLAKPAGTDKALVSVLNSNSDKIDAWAGTTNQALSNVNTAIAIEEISSSTSLATLISNAPALSVRRYFSVNKNNITDYPQTLTDSGAIYYINIEIDKRGPTIARVKITASTSSNAPITAEGLFYNNNFYWSQLALKSDVGNVQDLGVISNLNISNRTANCVYHFMFNSSSQNAPFSNSEGHGYLYVNTSSTYGRQIVYSNSGIATRKLHNGDFQAWVTIA